MQPSAKEIELELENTKNSIREGLHLVEQRIQTKMSDTKERITSRVENLKRAVDIQHQFNAHPLRMFAGSALVGFLTGVFVFGRSNVKRKGSRVVSLDNSVGARAN